MQSLQTDLRRNGPNISWQEVLAGGKICQDTIVNNRVQYDYNNCIEAQTNDYKFNELKIPYTDEYMVGLAQNIYDWNMGLKYIHRQGRDDIRRVSSTVAGLPSNPNYSSTYYTYTNEGRSETDVVTFSVQNNKPLEFFSIKNFFLLAFDWTNVKRNYTDYLDSLSNPQLANQWISYDGQFIRYADRPANNFVRPYTLRLTTTHTFNLWRTKWLWNNFFRYRSGYKAMAATTSGTNRDQFDTNGDGVLEYVDTFRPFDVSGAFTWDMRIGFEVDMVGGNILFVNLDIYNVLDSQNLIIASARYSATAGTTATPVYEVGRQFWLELGYKF